MKRTHLVTAVALMLDSSAVTHAVTTAAISDEKVASNRTGSGGQVFTTGIRYDFSL